MIGTLPFLRVTSLSSSASAAAAVAGDLAAVSTKAAAAMADDLVTASITTPSALDDDLATAGVDATTVTGTACNPSCEAGRDAATGEAEPEVKLSLEWLRSVLPAVASAFLMSVQGQPPCSSISPSCLPTW